MPAGPGQDPQLKAAPEGQDRAMASLQGTWELLATASRNPRSHSPTSRAHGAQQRFHALFTNVNEVSYAD